MRRRDFITLMGSAAAAWSLAARAQQPTMPVIGFLRNTSRDDSEILLTAIRRGLGQTGYVEGKNLAIEYRFADNNLDRLPALAADLVHRQVALIITGGDASSFAAKAATKTIPIIFSTGYDPVQIGLVSNIPRPDGNLTGTSFLSDATLAAKRLELLHELMPEISTIAYLSNPNNPSLEAELREVRRAANVLGLQILVLNAGSDHDFEMVFARIAQERARALLVGGDSLFTGRRDRLVALAASQRVPTIHYLREFPATGGLMSYGASITEAYRQTGIYAGEILKGTRPGDLPIVLPTKFELVINLTTAKAFGLKVPLSLILRADELLE